MNVAIGLYSLKWDGWGLEPTIWTVVMMTIATIIAAVISIQRQDTAYVLVIVWALVAIPLQGGFANAIRQANIPLILVTGWGLAVISIGINLATALQSQEKTTNHHASK